MSADDVLAPLRGGYTPTQICPMIFSAEEDRRSNTPHTHTRALTHKHVTDTDPTEKKCELSQILRLRLNYPPFVQEFLQVSPRTTTALRQQRHSGLVQHACGCVSILSGPV